DAVIQLVRVAVGIGRIEMPVRPGQIAASAADRAAALGEPVERVRHFLKRADLPGDLVDRAALGARVRVDGLQDLPREEDKRMMVGAVTREIPDRRPDLVALLGRHALGEIDRVGDAKAEQPAIEVLAALGIGDVDAEMPEAADAERTRQLHAADEEMFGDRLRNALGLVHFSLAVRLYARRTHRVSPTTSRRGFPET